MSETLLDTGTADGFGFNASNAAPVSRSSLFSSPKAVGTQYQQQLEMDAAAKEKKDKTNYWDGFKKAYQQNTGWVFESNGLTNDLIDPEYKHDLSKHKEMLKAAGAQPEHYDYFNQPVYSEKHAQLLVDRYKESRANDQYMADMGIAGSLAVNLAAGIADPIGIAAGVATGGVAYAYKAYKVARMVEAGMAATKAAEEVNKLSKTAMAVRGAVAGAAENMVVEGILSTKKPTWETDDLLWAGAFGAGFGGAGAFIGASLKAGSREHINNPVTGDDNAAIHRVGDGVEITSVRDDVRNGEYEVTPEIDRIINDPTQTDPVTEVGKRAADAEKRIKEIEDQIAAREAELKAINEGMPTQKTPLVGDAAQLKDPLTDPSRDFSHLLPEKARLELAGAAPGTVYSDLRTPSTKSGEDPKLKGERKTIKNSLEEFARGIMRDFLPEKKMYLTSTPGAIPVKYTKGVYGVTMSVSDDTFQITIPSKHMTSKQSYSTLAHELGHQVLNDNFYRAPAPVRKAIYDEYQKYLTDVAQMKSGDDVKHSRFTPDHAEKVYLPNGKDPAAELAGKYKKDYIFSFDEYMAERFAKYVQQKDDLTLPEAVKEYFAGIMEKLKALFGKVEGHLKTGTTVEQFFDDIRSGKYSGAKKVTDADLKKEADKVAKDIEKLREELGIHQKNYAAYDDFLRSDTAAELLKAAPETVMGNVRFDIAGQLLSSKNPIVRRLGSLLVNDPVGLKNGEVQRMTAEEGQKILQRQFEVAYYRDFTPLFEQWKVSQGLSLKDMWGARARFAEEVGMTYNGLHPNPSPEAQKMAQAYSKLMVEYNQHINDVGKLEGKSLGGMRSEPIPDDPSYFTRLHDKEKWHNFIAQHGVEGAEKFFKNAMLKGNPWLNDALSDKLAKSYVKKVRGMELEEYTSFDRAFSGNDLDELRKILDDMGVMSKDEIDTVVFELRSKTGRDGDAPANSRMKRRAMLDTSHEEVINGEKVNIGHFINMNVEEVFSTYNRQMSGAVSMARVGIRTKGDFDRMILQIADSARSIDGYAGSYAMKSEIESLDFAYKRIMGVPTNPDTAMTRVAGMLQKYNFMRLMNQMGLAQFQELSNILGQMGLKTALKSFPSLNTFIRDVKTGKITDQVMDELEVVIGHGSDLLKGHNVSERWLDEAGGFSSPASNKVMNTVDTALNKGINATMQISGFRYVNVMLQRWVSKALAQKFTDAAFGSEKVIKAEFRQMMGMDDAMYKRVLDQLKKHSKTEQGAIFGRNIKALNLNNWDDAQAAAAFTTGIFRWSRRMIQENDIGSMHRWMGSTAGQMIFQFRSFVLNAWSKSTLWGIHNRNTEMAMSLLWGTMMGSAVYAGRLWINSAGREDREEYLDKHLSLGSIVANGISRMSQASILPGLIDSTVAPLFGGQIFSESRTTGLAAGTGPFTDALGNPTLDLLNKLGNIPKTIGSDVLGDHDQNAASIRRSLGMLPWQNAMGVQQTLNVLAESLAD